MKYFTLALALGLVFVTTAPAQILSGSLSGSVADPSGQVIVGATVALISEVNGEQRSATTNETGDFIFPGLPPGGYTLRIEAKGFRTLERKNNNVLSAGRTTVGKLQLEVGSVAESVTVTARGQEVATTTTSQQAVLDSKQVTMISLRGRDPVSLLRILPGVQQGVEQDQFGGAYSTPVPYMQGTQSGNTMYVDGVNVGDGGGGDRLAGATNVDAISEINIQSNSYPAEYGLKGGVQLNIITKRGADQFHGSAYWYIRNEFFNANNWLSNKNNLPRVMYRYSTQGGTLGGPIPVKIPILNPRGNQMFFFYSLDDTQVKEPSVIRQWTMPTALERAGDFSQTRDLKGNLIVVKDPLNNNAPFTNNIIPLERKNAYGVALMNIPPLPNYAGACSSPTAGCNFLSQQPSLDHPRRQHLYRFDLRPTDKDSFSVKHQTWYTKIRGYEPATTSPGSNWGLYKQFYDFTADIGNVSYTRIISPSLVNELSGAVFYDTEAGKPTDEEQYRRIQRQYRGLSGLGQFVPENNPYNLIPWVGVGTMPNNSYFPSSITGNAALVGFDARTPNVGADSAFSASDNVTYIRGPHTFKLGVMWEFERMTQARGGTFAGQFDFSTDANDPGNIGYAYANMFTGHVRQYTEEMGRVPWYRIQTTWAWFVQDSWRLRRGVTLDIGLRIYKWSPSLHGGGEASGFSFERFDRTWGGKPPVLYAPVTTAQGRRALNPVTGEILPQTYVGMMVPGTGYGCNHLATVKDPCLFNGILMQDDPNYLTKGSRGFVDYVALQYDPRVGLAWDVFGDGKTAVRAGFGAFHNSSATSATIRGGPALLFPRSAYFTDMNSFLTATSATTPIDVSGVWRTGYKLPVNYNYNIGIQRDIGWHTVLDVAYVGNLTHHNTQSWNFNALPNGVRFLPASQDPTSPGKPLPDVFLRPIIGYGSVSMTGPATKSRYDSLQVQANRRFTGGVEIGGTFTYAGGTSDGWYQNNPLPSSAARSRNLNVQQFVFNLSYVVDVPRGSRLVKLPGAKWVLDDWQWSGITTFANGGLSNITLSTTDSFDFMGGGESCGVVQTADAKLPRGERTWDRWFNTAVFQRPSGRGDPGNNCGNAKFRLPGFNNHDVSLFKNFPIREGKTLQLRWELYNTLNHTQFNAVDTTANFNPAGVQTRATFGRVTSARTERRMQLALRFTF